MKRLIIAIIAALTGFVPAYLVFVSGNDVSAEVSSSSVQQYTCGMHPEIISDEPGYCPICSMKLTPKKDGSSSAAGAILIDPATSHNMGVATSAAVYQNLVRKVESFGEVAFSEPNVLTINLKIDGWVEKLFVNETGVEILKNQPLFEIYSPKLIAAQEEYINALSQAKDNPSSGSQSILKAARMRLSNWDISEDRIEALTGISDIKRTVLFRSPASGIVTVKNVNDGDYVKPGMELYRIDDLSTVWVKAYIYEQDVSYIKKGQSADITVFALPGQSYRAEIDYISPFLNSKKQVELRFEIDNPKYLLHPGMYAEVTIYSQLDGKCLVIPYSAVIHSGIKEIVYVKSGKDSYMPRRITTGAVGDDDLVEVVSGLNEGEQVVISGQFMLDSESRLNEALADGANVGHNHGGQSEEHKMESTPAEMEKSDPDEPAATGGHDIYTCPMPVHYNQLQYGEGNCSECGMKLVPLGQTGNKNVYVCPMTECATVQDHKGICPVCGMNLVRYRPDDRENTDAE